MDQLGIIDDVKIDEMGCLGLFFCKALFLRREKMVQIYYRSLLKFRVFLPFLVFVFGFACVFVYVFVKIIINPWPRFMETGEVV